jgi:hypothetical protein
MAEETSGYPDRVVRNLTSRQTSSQSTETTAVTETITVAITGIPDRLAVERTLNSFLNCCTDIDKVHRFVLINGELSAEDRTTILEKYPFLESTPQGVGDERYVLTLVAGWQFVEPEPIINRLSAVFDDEPDVARVAVTTCEIPTIGQAGAQPAEFRTSETGDRYLMTNRPVAGHVLVNTAREDPSNPRPRVAVLDELLCFTESTTNAAVSKA